MSYHGVLQLDLVGGTLAMMLMFNVAVRFLGQPLLLALVACTLGLVVILINFLRIKDTKPKKFIMVVAGLILWGNILVSYTTV